MTKYIGAALLVLALAGMAGARSHKRQSNRSGFDYYLLVLSWAPDYCATDHANRTSRECGTGNHAGFIVHGLWPQFNDGGYPKECAPASPVASPIVDRMLPYMYDAGLVQHEWKQHGTCTGLDSATYFGDIRQVFDSVHLPDEYKNLNREIQVKPRDLEGKFAEANPSIPQEAYRIGCAGGNALSDVRICFSKDLHAQACPASERDCRADSLTMLPQR